MDILKLNKSNGLPENYTGIIEWNTGTMCYYLNEILHREDGPAVITSFGNRFYYLNGKRHRTDGPAIIWDNGDIIYFLNGLCHREDGPAIIRTDGTIEYFLNDKEITKEVNNWIKENNIPEIWNNSHKIFFKLTFG